MTRSLTACKAIDDCWTDFSECVIVIVMPAGEVDTFFTIRKTTARWANTKKGNNVLR